MEKKPVSKVKQAAKPAQVKIPDIFAFTFKTKCIILAIIGFVFYADSIPSEYAHDDALTIIENAYVQKGFAGIPKILTNDSYASYYNNLGGDPNSQLSGGRYRPLSEIIFAIEQGIFGDSEILPHLRHFLNVIAYMFCLLCIFYFLDKYLLAKVPQGSDCAFLATVLFAIHPLHTEVVANIKSLDEILSITFIMLTFIFSLQYLKEKKTKQLIFGCVSFFLSLLAKEYAITLVFFIPLLFYLLAGKNPVDAFMATIPYFGVMVVYAALRYHAVGFNSNAVSTDVLSNPYYYVTSPVQRVATEWYVMGKYLKLLFLPFPLTADYSFYEIKYRTFSDMLALLPLLAYIALTVWGVRLLFKKNILAFPVLFFLLNILMISNFVMPIGATMGERLVFHSSLGFVIVISFYFLKALSKQPFQTKKLIVLGVTCVLSLLAMGETWVRNIQWYDTDSLFLHDVFIVPNSCLANNNASYAYLKKCEDAYKDNKPDEANKCLDSAQKYGFRALKINKNYMAADLNLGAVFFHKQNPDSAKIFWKRADSLMYGHLDMKTKYASLVGMYYQKGLDKGKAGDPFGGISYLRKAASLDDTNADIWYNLGGAYFTVKLYDSARSAWLKTLKLKPGDANTINGLKAIEGINTPK